MKEYKFRAWHAHTRNMLNNDIIHKLIEGTRIVLTDQNVIKKEKLGNDYLKSKLAPEHWKIEGNPFNNCNLKIMQFIGLKDKNGKEIYEGDICKCTNRIKNEIFKVAWWLNGCEFTGYFNDKTAESLMKIHAFNDIEIIGNIYENPEYLK